MNQPIISIEHVSKEYRLGAIGGGTLRGDLQSWMARIRKKEDPNLKIGEEIHDSNERFLALKDVSFQVEKGEALGIIGHNGAGKSTLLKLLSRVTAPTSGKISFNGRIASMLEVGTGFHPELTGRENVYMNGAILGMKKTEISKKFDQIVAFAGMEQFIDTPVKRYSSGMYVKLAFAVAAHLDSEIMVMDEVLAVGDAQFQQKCLGRMGDASADEGRTVLYVSHNMNTVRSLCTRCVVLNHGQVQFIGNTEEAISLYLDNQQEVSMEYDYSGRKELVAKPVQIHGFSINEKDSPEFYTGDIIKASLKIYSMMPQKDIRIRFEVFNDREFVVGTMFSELSFNLKQGENQIDICIPLERMMPSNYKVTVLLYQSNSFGSQTFLDRVAEAFRFSIIEKEGTDLVWLPHYWGSVKLPDIKIAKVY